MLDPNVIANLIELERQGSPGLLRDLVNLFRTRTPDLLREMECALKARDSAKIERCAHNLKSSCGNLGAVELSRLGAELMRVATNFTEVARQIEAFRREYQVVVQELEAAAHGDQCKN